MPNNRRKTPRKRLKGGLGEPIFDDLGRIVGFVGGPKLKEPIDLTEQAIARAVAGTVGYAPPLVTKTRVSPEVIRRTLVLPSSPQEMPLEEKAKQDALIRYFTGLYGRRYGI